MLTSRERVLNALNFRPVDRLPCDLGGTRSSGISAFAYPRLVEALGLPPRDILIEDTLQMLALPDRDVLDALGIDVVAILDGVTNALDQPDLWHDYKFNGRLHAKVRWPQNFRAQENGAIVQVPNLRMVPDAYVFDEEHGGQPVEWENELPRPDLKNVYQSCEKAILQDEQIVALRELCRRVRENTDRAVVLTEKSIKTVMGIGSFTGIGLFPILCITDPDYVIELHEMLCRFQLENLQRLLPEIWKYVDVIKMLSDDWGTQQNLIASPKVFRKLFLPYYHRLNNAVHTLAPGVKTLLHSCGAIYDLLDLVIESGFDALNPVQWSAGKHSVQEWKDKCRGRIVLWGGGVNAQATLPHGSIDDVYFEAQMSAQILGQDSGYIFCNIHNLLAEIDPYKIIAMYRATR